jgi:hypothetical protein
LETPVLCHVSLDVHSQSEIINHPKIIYISEPDHQIFMRFAAFGEKSCLLSVSIDILKMLYFFNIYFDTFKKRDKNENLNV